MKKRTEDGLAIITEETFIDFLRSYDISSAENDPAVTLRIKLENPQIYRILKLGMQGNSSKEAKVYYECGIQIVYELLRRQTSSNNQK